MATGGMTVSESPTLTAGDHLTRAEFLRRWKANARIKRAELIEGIGYMPSPVTVEHGDMESVLGTWIGLYDTHTPGTTSGHNTTTFLLDEETPQPDINLRILQNYGGASWLEAS